jgi:hypothetical protein
LLAFKHLHQACYAEYSVTVTIIEQIKTWDNMVIFRYIASKKNMRALVAKSETTVDTNHGVPFDQFAQAVQVDYKRFDFRYYRQHYEAQAKHVALFYEKNSLTLQKLATSFRRVEGSDEFETSYADFRNQVKTFEVINKVIDNRSREKLAVTFDGMRDKPDADDEEDLSDPDDLYHGEGPHDDHSDEADDDWSQESGQGAQWYPNPIQEQILNFEGDSHHDDDDLGDETDMDEAEGNVLPIHKPHPATRPHGPRESIMGDDEMIGHSSDFQDDDDDYDDGDRPISTHHLRASATHAQKESQSLAYAKQTDRESEALVAHQENASLSHASVEAFRTPVAPESVPAVFPSTNNEKLEATVKAQLEAQTAMMNTFAASLQGLMGTLTTLVQKTADKQERESQQAAMVPIVQSVNPTTTFAQQFAHQQVTQQHEVHQEIHALPTDVPPANFLPIPEHDDLNDDLDLPPSHPTQSASLAPVDHLPPPSDADDEMQDTEEPTKQDYNAINPIDGNDDDLFAEHPSPLNMQGWKNEGAKLRTYTAPLSSRTQLPPSGSRIADLKEDVFEKQFGNPEDLTEIDEDEKMPELRIPTHRQNRDPPLPPLIKTLPKPIAKPQVQPPGPSDRLSAKFDADVRAFNARLHKASLPLRTQTFRTPQRVSEAPKNVFSRYIKKTLLPLDEPISYPVNLKVEELSRKKKRCRDQQIQKRRQIIHDDYNQYSDEVKNRVINPLITPERDQIRQAERPNPVEINRRIDKFLKNSVVDDRVHSTNNYSHQLEEDEKYDNVDMDLTKELLSTSFATSKKRMVAARDDTASWKGAKNQMLLLDANGNYAPRQRSICPCKKTRWGWEVTGEITGVVPRTRIFKDARTGPCKGCDDGKASEAGIKAAANQIVGFRKLAAKAPKKPQVRPPRHSERRLMDLKAKFRSSLPL